MEHKIEWEKIVGIIGMAAAAALLGVSIYLCFGSDIWYDELFTMGLAEQSCGELISITARDVHPPLYYLIVKFFLAVSGVVTGSIQPVVIGKLVSVLPFFLCLIYALTKVRKQFGMLCAGIFSFLLLTMPQLADYTVEIRMYSYALFFILAAMLHAYELAHGEKKKKWIDWTALTLYSLAACYTHYFACVAACMVYLYLLVSLCRAHRMKQEGKAFFASGLLCGGAYVPWLLLAVTGQVGQVKESYWIQPLGWRSLGGCAKFLFQPLFSSQVLNAVLAVLFFLCYAGLLAGMVLKWIRQKEVQETALFTAGCVWVLLGIVFFGFLASFLIRPIFVYRYMLPALGVFWLAFALLVSGLKEKKFLFFLLLVLLGVVGFRNYRAFYGEEMWKRVQMEQAEEVFGGIGAEDKLIFNFDQTQAVVSYYLPNQTYLWYGNPEELVCEIYPHNHGLVEDDFSDEKGIAALKELLMDGKSVWFLGSGNARDEIIEKWENAGIKAEECGSAMVERYWFNLYKIFLIE
ncbi:hypothetical protein IMSAGC005_01277 [Lachnospiraceae bacterium]|nr:hypothetical protein IMSAGC005_01277 [Lachnospiraceae bacterium]